MKNRSSRRRLAVEFPPTYCLTDPEKSDHGLSYCRHENGATGDDLESGRAIIHDQPGNEQVWTVTANTGATVQDIVNATAGLRFEYANGSLDNYETVSVTSDPVNFSGFAGSLTNWAGATLTSTSNGVALSSGGSVNNAGTINGDVSVPSFSMP